MASFGQRYRYKEATIEVAKGPDGPDDFGNYICLVRGNGENNKGLRKKYRILAVTSAQASRRALLEFMKEYGQEIK